MAEKKIPKPMPAHARATLIQSITEKRHAMMSRCRYVLDQGKLEEGRALFASIEKLTEDLEQLERAAKDPAGADPSPKRSTARARTRGPRRKTDSR